ncbi:MAG: hypothetical protein ACYDCP_04285 [Thermoplasmataceae archaeon]
MLESAVYIPSGTISTTDFGDVYYSSAVGERRIDLSYRIDKTKHIGRFVLPDEVTIRYEEEEEIVCALCDDLSLVSCSFDAEKAKNGLEEELKEAINVYIHLLMEADLDPNATKYRVKLAEIERLNSA